jgi:hypothetical protein
MKLTGQFPPTTRSETILGWFGLVIVIAFLLPWIVMAVGCIVVGAGSLLQGDYALAICLPAGLALLILPIVLFYLDHRWYARVSNFALDGRQITYSVPGAKDAKMQEIDDVRWVKTRMHRGKTRGYLVKFHDGSGVFVCRSLTNADELARALKESAKMRTNVARV